MTALCRTRAARRQAGSSLIISTILLVVLTLIVLSVIKSTTVNSKVAGNLQIKKESEAAAQQAIEAVLSTNFQVAPAASSVAVNVSNAASGSAVGQYTVTVPAPTCLSVTPINVTDLDPSVAANASCFVSSTPVTPGVPNPKSLCYQTQWDIAATVSPTAGNGAKVEIHQGISVPVAVGTTCP